MQIRNKTNTRQSDNLEISLSVLNKIRVKELTSVRGRFINFPTRFVADLELILLSDKF